MNNFTEDVVIKNITYTIWNTLYFSRDAFKRILNIFYIQENIKVILFLRMRREGVEKAIPVIPHFVSHLLMMVNVTTKKIKWWYDYNRQDSSDFDSIFWLWLWLFIICESSKFDLINFLLNKSRKSAEWSEWSEPTLTDRLSQKDTRGGWWSWDQAWTIWTGTFSM